MSIHIGAEPGQIASTVLLPGDPLRAKFIAERYFESPICFNEVRNMLGFTGSYHGKRVSVMGSGMGMPTLAIYINELVQEYNVQRLIRVGTSGAFQPHLKVGDLVLAMTASTDSNMNRIRFNGMDFAPASNFELLLRAYQVATERGIKVHVGGMFAGDQFYNPDPNWWTLWAEYGLLVCEMESSALYTLAAKFGVEALSILTVSDSLATGESSTPEQRERGFPIMAELALEIA
jgi:purine-nucleoside phosphorylase